MAFQSLWKPILNNQVDIIDGQLEGVLVDYLLNYQFEIPSGLNNGDKDTYGFMDMGGLLKQVHLHLPIWLILTKEYQLSWLNDNHSMTYL